MDEEETEIESEKEGARLSSSTNNSVTATVVLTSADHQHPINSSIDEHKACPEHRLVYVRDSNDDFALGVSVMHAIGHAIGLPEDDGEDGCDCRTTRGTCFMNASPEGRSLWWSKCSLERLRTMEEKGDPCLRHLQQDPRRPSSGRLLLLVVRILLTAACLLTLAALSLLIIQRCSHVSQPPILLQTHTLPST